MSGRKEAGIKTGIKTEIKAGLEAGKAPVNVLKRSVLRRIKEEGDEAPGGAGVGRDCAGLWLAPGEGLATCVQEAAVEASCPGGNGDGVLPGLSGGCALADSEPVLTMAELVQKCANNLAAGGSLPVAAAVALLLPESVEEPYIKELMSQAADKCRELSMRILGGQTRVTRAAALPMAVVTGYGRYPGAADGARAALPGQDVVVSKWIGLQGTAYLAKRNRDGLLCRYPAYLVEEAMGFCRYLSVLPEALAAVRAGAGAMHDASEGGIFGALWELAERHGVGLTVDMRRLPLRQETVEVCEYCGANPYELLSGGCLVMTARDGGALAAALEAEHIPARVVGRVTDGNDRILVNGDEIRYLDRPRRDSVYHVV